jgi:hypothetical protein
MNVHKLIGVVVLLLLAVLPAFSMKTDYARKESTQYFLASPMNAFGMAQGGRITTEYTVAPSGMAVGGSGFAKSAFYIVILQQSQYDIWYHRTVTDPHARTYTPP